MRRRIELKAYSADLRRLGEVCDSGGGERMPVEEHLDQALRARRGHLLLRTSGARCALLSYQRLSSPLLRESRSWEVEVSDPDTTRAALETSLGQKGPQLRKKRCTWSWPDLQVSLDEVEGLGTFVEISAEIDAGNEGEERATKRAAELRDRLGIESGDLLPYSYADLALMMESALSHRARLSDRSGKMFIVDGASCSGKTTLVSWLLEDGGLDLHLVPRYCTREPRPGEESGSEYIFTSMEEFQDLAASGQLMEFRDFEFGMSYGLSWPAATETLCAGRDGLGIMNLGNIRHLKRVFPEARTILVRAPLEVIRRRLVARGMNVEEQILERLGNAALVDSYRQDYDHVVDNDDGLLERVKAQLGEIFRGEID